MSDRGSDNPQTTQFHYHLELTPRSSRSPIPRCGRCSTTSATTSARCCGSSTRCWRSFPTSMRSGRSGSIRRWSANSPPETAPARSLSTGRRLARAPIVDGHGGPSRRRHLRALPALLRRSRRTATERVGGRRRARRPRLHARAARERERPTSASPPITSSSRSATSSGPATRRATASTPTCSAQFPLVEEALRGARRRGLADGRARGRRRAGRGRSASRRGPAGRPGAHLHARQGPRPVRGRGARRHARPAARASVDEAGVREKFGVAAGLDPRSPRPRRRRADGFPGLPGLGREVDRRRARPLRPPRGDPRGRGDWQLQLRGAAKLAATLAPARPALLFRDLATLREDAPVGKVDEWRWRGPTSAFADWVQRLGLDRITERVRGLADRRARGSGAARPHF